MESKNEPIYYLLHEQDTNSVNDMLLPKDDSIQTFSDDFNDSNLIMETQSSEINASIQRHMEHEEEEDNEEEENHEHYLQKIQDSMRHHIMETYHMDSIPITYEKMMALSQVIRDKDGCIIDAFHTTLPMITKYEKARILGERAKQLEAGAPSMITDTIIDSYLLALREYEQKKIPFIIKRPLPNGTCEYWRFQDLEIM
jgi:DNA-directed RNA polymerase subunit K/omega